MDTEKSERSWRQYATRILKSVSDSYSINWKAYPTSTYTWAGDGVLRPSERKAIRVLHDVAHCALASPKRRTIPEWGLGEDPSNYGWAVDAPPPLTVSPLFAQEEEEAACDLTWVLAAYHGGSAAAEEVQKDLFMEPLSASRIKALRAYRRLECLPPAIWEGAFAFTVR